MRNTLSLGTYEGKKVYKRKVTKLWTEGRVSIKDYEWEQVAQSGLPLLIIFSYTQMLLSPLQVKQGRYTASRFHENYEPYKRGFLVNFTYKAMPPLQSTLFESNNL